jgi:hypothetical protein
LKNRQTTAVLSQKQAGEAMPEAEYKRKAGESGLASLLQ